MKTARIHEYGDESVIRHEDVERPVPGPGEVLVEVAATAFNPTETALRSGRLRTITPVDLPYTLGWDVSGTVAATGPGTEAFSVGDEVIGWLDGGAAAEYAVAPATRLVPAPSTVPLPHAAAIPLAGLTAWQAVFEAARVTPGQRVLINGAGGGIGGFAVQLTKYAGAHVIATASARSARTVRRLGADQLVDYTTIAVRDAVAEPVDTVLNLVPIGRKQTADLVSLVRPGGAVVSVATPVHVPGDSHVTAAHMITRNDPAQLSDLVALVDSGAVRIDVTGTRRLGDLAQVHRECAAGRIRGKVIVLPS